jgi:fatty-acyl-CoA synthase
MGYNFGDIQEAIEKVIDPARLAHVHVEPGKETRTITWGQTAKRSANLARAMLAAGAVTGDKVAFYLRNGPEYSETLSATFKARLTHVNVNYRYQAQELLYIFDNSDAAVILYNAEFAPAIAELKAQLPKVKLFVEVGDGAPMNDFAVSYEDLVTSGPGTPLGLERQGDDLLFLYTGGTTGMPKGVMWPQGSLNQHQLNAWSLLEEFVPANAAGYGTMLEQTPPTGVALPACPMMHGTGMVAAITAQAIGSTIVTLGGKNFDPELVWQAVHDHRITSISIVGDAFARPLLGVLDANPGKYDVSCVLRMASSGVMWSQENKMGLIKHMPQVTLIDSLAASEGFGFGISQTTAEGETQTAKFTVGARAKVFSEDLREIEPGSDEQGFLAVTGPIPIGYYKDAEKTASTFKEINGTLYSVPGDYAKVAEDGTLILLGRGSVCINTAGEKVYPEEVEEALKTHEQVEDALVIGISDEKWGQKVVAVVTPIDNLKGGDPQEAELRDHVRGQLAAYKVPKSVHFFHHLRAPNGKADYKGAKAFAEKELGQE